MEHALKVGYRHIDCADAYSNHKEVGEAFNKVFSDPDGPKREDVWITTKLNNPDHEPSKVSSPFSITSCQISPQSALQRIWSHTKYDV